MEKATVKPCPACGAERTEADACDRCGAVYGERHRCPHCGGITRAERDAHKGWLCGACHGPRFRGISRDEELEGALKEAHREGSRAGPLAVGHGLLVGLALFGVLAAVAWLAIAGIGIVSAAIFVAWIGAALTGARALRRGRAIVLDRSGQAFSRAKVRAAEIALADAGGTTTAEELAQRLGTGVDDAQLVLNTLATSDRVRIDMNDDTRVRYSMDPVLEASDADDAPERGEAAPLADERRRRDPNIG